MTEASRLARFAAGVRVLDLSSFIPGPWATQMLADMGAEVLKVEPPGGDAMATLGPRDAEGRSVFHATLNAGKSVRRMDLKRPEQRDAFLDLVRAHDVLVEGFRPGVMERLGLGWETLRDANSRLILCSLSGYGATGPMAQAPGHDANYLAAVGILHRNGTPDPVFYDPPLSDVASGLFAVVAILGALRARDADGRGCRIDLGLADTLMPLQAIQLAALGATGVVPKPGGSYLNGGAAYYQVYRTQDGRHVALGAVEPKFWAAFCRAAGRPDWVERQPEPEPQRALTAELAAWFAARTLAECLDRFADPACCISPVIDLADAVASSQCRARGLVREIGGTMQALFPARVDGLAPAPRQSIRED